MDRCEFAALLFLERALSGRMTVDRSGVCAFARSAALNAAATASRARHLRSDLDDVNVGMA